jgi:hypothetical protein
MMSDSSRIASVWKSVDERPVVRSAGSRVDTDVCGQRTASRADFRKPSEVCIWVPDAHREAVPSARSQVRRWSCPLSHRAALSVVAGNTEVAHVCRPSLEARNAAAVRAGVDPRPLTRVQRRRSCENAVEPE